MHSLPILASAALALSGGSHVTYGLPFRPAPRGLFKHSKLNQRQRRRYNRQRFAAGDRHAFG